jgi:hypothetical protein
MSDLRYNSVQTNPPQGTPTSIPLSRDSRFLWAIQPFRRTDQNGAFYSFGLTRLAANDEKQMPALALRYTEILMVELALVALDHERNLQAMNNVARSMQSHIDDESGATKPAPLAIDR